MLRAVLFDYDGTLVDSMQSHFYAWSTVLKSYDIELREDQFFPYEGEKLDSLLARVLKKREYDAQEIIAKKDEVYIKNSHFKLYNGVENFLKLLKSIKLKTAIVTAGRRERLVATAPKEFLEKFDAIIAYGDTKNGKPHSEPYLTAARKLRVHSEDCMVIENAPLGVKSAKSAGMECIAIASTLRDDMLLDADLIIHNFDQLNRLEYFSHCEEIV
jgi:beta-phosphoglucomutase